ncbi:conserved putative ankyrin repeat-containing protein [Tokyovirus A1]|uniref:conserved putative ankyrin repeat-containing protein n=1 Tax=Tokyovirus A1 TaxID=1826170 RepID=UPI0007A97D04|nr:conserved putative ankyrin repeat-containing protein [Tokyovirus A1]BAU80248.1 conserved putative ankyrin repeat-containing protein [Tokyovirus A1]
MSCNIKGLFEIHVTVDNLDVVDLLFYCKQKNYKAIFACSGRGSDNTQSQAMMSKWCSGTSDVAIQKANSIAKDLSESGFSVLRVKVEAMQCNEGVPATKEDAKKCILGTYFEFHLKYPPRECRLENEKLFEDACLVSAKIKSECEFKFGVSTNILSQKVGSLFTIRVFDSWKEEAQSIKDQFLDGLKELGYRSNDGIQQEWAFFDTDKTIDDGWLV